MERRNTSGWTRESLILQAVVLIWACCHNGSRRQLARAPSHRATVLLPLCQLLWETCSVCSSEPDRQLSGFCLGLRGIRWAESAFSYSNTTKRANTAEISSARRCEGNSSGRLAEGAQLTRRPKSQAAEQAPVGQLAPVLRGQTGPCRWFRRIYYQCPRAATTLPDSGVRAAVNMMRAGLSRVA